LPVIASFLFGLRLLDATLAFDSASIFDILFAFTDFGCISSCVILVATSCGFVFGGTLPCLRGSVLAFRHLTATSVTDSASISDVILRIVTIRYVCLRFGLDFDVLRGVAPYLVVTMRQFEGV
jgi:hypothetical protein